MLNRTEFHLKRVIRNSKNILFLTIFIISLSSCEEKIGQFGSDILPDSDFVHLRTDSTTNIELKPDAIDSIFSSFSSTAIIGSYVDSIFGQTTSQFASQINLSQSSLFEDATSVQSVTLRLLYKEHIGNLSDNLILNIYELDNNDGSNGLTDDQMYYSSGSIDDYVAGKSLLTSLNVNIEDALYIYDTLTTNSDTTVRKVFDISLPVEYGEKLISLSDSVYRYNKVDKFFDQVGGIYIETTPISEGGALVSLNLSSTLSSVLIDYTTRKYGDSIFYQYFSLVPQKNSYTKYNSNNVSNDTLYYVNTANICFYEHNYGLPGLKTPTLGQTEANLYFSSLAGLNTKIYFPDLKEWFNRDYKMINDVELVIKPDTTNSYYKEYGLPESLWIKPLDENDNEIATDSTTAEYGQALIGGTYDDTRNQYVFHIPVHINNILDNKEENNGFVLYLHESTWHMFSKYKSSVIIPDQNDPVKLRVTYITE